MKLLIFGATGATGQQLVRQALDQQFLVTAFVRDAGKLMMQHPNLRVMIGDIKRPETVRAAMPGQEAVLSALGVRHNRSRDTTLSDGTRGILEAMEQHQVRRFICETSMGVGSSKGEGSWLFEKIFVPLFLKHIMADKERQEALIQRSPLDWTIVRPAGLTNGPGTGDYKVGLSLANTRIKNRISRADVADFMLRQLTTDAFVRKAVNISC